MKGEFALLASFGGSAMKQGKLVRAAARRAQPRRFVSLSSGSRTRTVMPS